MKYDVYQSYVGKSFINTGNLTDKNKDKTDGRTDKNTEVI